MSVAVAVLVWLAAGYRLAILVRHRNLLNSMYFLSFAAAGAAFTAKLFEQRIDAAAGPYVGDLTKHLLVVAMGAFLQLYIITVESGRPSRNAIVVRVGVATLVAAAMTITFAAAPIHTLAQAEDLDRAFIDLAQVQAYLLIFNLYLSYILIDNIKLYRRFAAAPGDEGRSTNLRLVGWGSAAGLIYSLTRLVSVLSTALIGHPLTALEAVGSAAALVGGAFVAVAVFSPKVVPWLRDRHTARVGSRRLETLWRDLTSAYPAVVLPVKTVSVASRRAEFVYDRRLVEISECLRLVRLPESAPAAILGAASPMSALASELYNGRKKWTSTTGPSPIRFLPHARTQAEEAQMLLQLADEYTAVHRTQSVSAALTR